MNVNQLSENIDRWAELVREYQAESDQRGAERMRNWLFGAGLALQLLDDPALLGIALRALEASTNGHIRNCALGADPSDDMGISSVDSQREDMARATRCPRTAGADGGA